MNFATPLLARRVIHITATRPGILSQAGSLYVRNASGWTRASGTHGAALMNWKRHPLAMGVTTVIVMYSHNLLSKTPIYCVGEKDSTTTTKPSNTSPFSTDPSRNGTPSAGGADYTGVTFGVAMGFCSGYMVKKAGKIAALAVGAGFIFLQMLEHNGYITISWKQLESDYKRELDFDGDGVVSQKDAKIAFDRVVKYLGGKWQMNGGFAGGFLLGLKTG